MREPVAIKIVFEFHVEPEPVAEPLLHVDAVRGSDRTKVPSSSDSPMHVCNLLVSGDDWIGPKNMAPLTIGTSVTSRKPFDSAARDSVPCLHAADKPKINPTEEKNTKVTISVRKKTQPRTAPWFSAVILPPSRDLEGPTSWTPSVVVVPGLAFRRMRDRLEPLGVTVMPCRLEIGDSVDSGNPPGHSPALL